MPAWMTSLLRDEMPVPTASAASSTMTSRPLRASSRATARPMIPAPATTASNALHAVSAPLSSESQVHWQSGRQPSARDPLPGVECRRCRCDNMIARMAMHALSWQAHPRFRDSGGHKSMQQLVYITAVIVQGTAWGAQFTMLKLAAEGGYGELTVLLIAMFLVSSCYLVDSPGAPVPVSPDGEVPGVLRHYRVYRLCPATGGRALCRTAPASRRHHG